MWLDRFSAHSTPSASPPPRNRVYSPAPRKPSYLGQLNLTRPGLSPRSSSVSLSLSVDTSPSASTISLPTAARNESALRNVVLTLPPDDVEDPLDVLSRLLKEAGAKVDFKDVSTDLSDITRPDELAENVEFGGLSLQEFCERDEDYSAPSGVDSYESGTLDDYENQKDKFDDLHRSILACDDVLKTVETSLKSFQNDLGAVSAEIETLQTRSARLNERLNNRKAVEKILGPAVEEISISPGIVKKISEGAVDPAWILALQEVEKRMKTAESKTRDQKNIKAMEDFVPLLDDLSNKAIERIRDYLVAQIKGLRSPNINAQIIQQQYFVKYKDLFSFLSKRQPQLSEEISQAYINTMRWYYLHHFSRYHQALDKIKIYGIDKYDALGTDHTSQRGNVMSSKTPNVPHDAFNLGRRLDILTTSSHMAISSYLAEEDKSSHYLEMPFRNFNLALVDNASAEFSFMTEFFSSMPFSQITRKFNEILEPTCALGQSFTKQLIEHSFDGLGILLCVRLNQHNAFELQRRKCPAMESYINGTNILLWPRFQIIMDFHCESMKRATASTSGRSTASALLTSNDTTKQSTAPHPFTQRFGQFLQAILSLSSESGDDEPVSSSLGRLRTDFEAFLAKVGRGVGDSRKKERFLFNNYSLVQTIISDTQGKLADEQKEHYETLMKAVQSSR
ncbi:MAG: hypothetical protein M1834_003779 [Cirrosporium novae-zelandiae]|nr:MAG: hypothetical protein M1834_003779 [Cirrosporium novae-zelandiae]